MPWATASSVSSSRSVIWFTKGVSLKMAFSSRRTISGLELFFISSPMRLLSSWPAQPRCVSRIWPTFMRLGTPRGLSTISTGVPSAR